MVEIVGRISKGTRMDQIYVPKDRMPGFEIGAAVLVRPALGKTAHKPYYYKTRDLEPIKNIIISRIMESFDQFENVIIAGSFLEKGFDFSDIDVLLISDKNFDASRFSARFERELGIKLHIIVIDFKSLIKGMGTDPLFQAMLSKFVSKKRVIFRAKREINYKLLDLHLLESKSLIDNFYFLTGKEKFRMSRNLIAIKMFIENRKIDAESINMEINKCFGKGMAGNIKSNLLDREFLNKYSGLYKKIFNRVMDGIKDGDAEKRSTPPAGGSRKKTPVS